MVTIVITVILIAKENAKTVELTNLLTEKRNCALIAIKMFPKFDQSAFIFVIRLTINKNLSNY